MSQYGPEAARFVRDEVPRGQAGQSSTMEIASRLCAGPAPGNTSATAGGGANETGSTSPRSYGLKLVLEE
jgi:hypothetical protein